MSGNSKNIWLDRRLESYHTEVVQSWSNDLEKLSRDSAVFRAITLDLIFDLKAALHTASLPWLMVKQIKSFHDGITAENQSWGVAKLTNELIRRLVSELRDESIQPDQLQVVRSTALRVAGDVEKARKRAASEFSDKKVWHGYLKETAFQLIITGSQRNAFIAVYNAYECFLVHAIKIALNLESLRVSESKKFRAAFHEAFGDPLIQQCWNDETVNLARVARHSLAHAGSRLTPDLEKLSHSFPVVDGRIQVLPEHVKWLTRLVENCSLQLVRCRS